MINLAPVIAYVFENWGVKHWLLTGLAAFAVFGYIPLVRYIEGRISNND